MAVEVIELRKTNLYGNADFLQFPDGEQLVVRKPIEWRGELTDRYHTLLEGETLDWVAWKYYQTRAGDNAGELWWIIADVNKIANPFDLEDFVGTELLIPNYDKFNLQL